MLYLKLVKKNRVVAIALTVILAMGIMAYSYHGYDGVGERIYLDARGKVVESASEAHSYITPLEQQGERWAYHLYDLDGSKMLRGYLDKPSLDDGHLVGEVTRYHANGNTMMLATADESSRLQGMTITYHESGGLSHIYFSLAGVMHGSFSTYHENGSLKEQGYYLNGSRQGESLTYDEEGRLISRYHYHSGQLHGVAENYCDNERLCTVTHYRHGLRDGGAQRYRGDGSLRVDEYYRNDTLIVHKRFSTTGGLVELRYNDENGEQLVGLRYYNDGGIQVRTTRRQTPHGTGTLRESLARNDQSLTQRTWRVNNENTDWSLEERFSHSGRVVRSRREKLDGRFHGAYVDNAVLVYRKEGREVATVGDVVMKGIYHHGTRVGTWIETRRNGHVVRKHYDEDGELHGNYYEYSKDAALISFLQYRHGVLNGVYMRILDGDMFLFDKGHMEDGNAVGAWLSYSSRYGHKITHRLPDGNGRYEYHYRNIPDLYRYTEYLGADMYCSISYRDGEQYGRILYFMDQRDTECGSMADDHSS
ncbi:toxin-antitoxin system YwqK family antitoxin [Halomonas salipaludis]|uniref:Antitoxin component YwqK of YwqJK toxin-antitoxin module n=1 Tax=Halomonas salipaludis TaxID=2032625 RepID=A0A2A2F441_9GAMM|nr:toxin-antitoxin system YwqK family antitoxin [Halomonas salipaludis]PAU79474.1 hypothetical protein CK498_03680 [Halomonas salipaludis]